MDFKEYQLNARKTALYPKNYQTTYPLLGLTGEVGEFANKYKKVIRDGIVLDRADVAKELGDILWYVSNLASDLSLDLDDIATGNIAKLADRQQRGVIKGSGDNR